MKRLIAIFVFLSVASMAAAQEYPWSWHTEGNALKGQVKEVREYQFAWGPAYGDVAQVKEDPNGNTCYNHGQVTITTYTYKYDRHGNWTTLFRNGKLETMRIIDYYD